MPTQLLLERELELSDVNLSKLKKRWNVVDEDSVDDALLRTTLRKEKEVLEGQMRGLLYQNIYNRLMEDCSFYSKLENPLTEGELKDDYMEVRLMVIKSSLAKINTIKNPRIKKELIRECTKAYIAVICGSGYNLT